mgnify:CR=1 FL=1
MKTLLSLKSRIWLTLIMLSVVSFECAAQILHQESFDSTTFVPAGWSLDPSAGNPIWVRRTTGPIGSTMTPHSGAAMARYTVVQTPTGSQQSLITPVIDYSYTNGATPSVSFWMYRDSLSTAPDTISVWVNTSPSITGATWLGVIARSRYQNIPVLVTSNGWYQYSFNIPSAFNTSVNYILFRGTAQGGANMFIDDVEWDEYPVPCSGQPVAGTISASNDTICGGSGSADLSLTGGSGLQSGLTYDWQSSGTAGGPWTSFSTASGPVNTGTLTATTYFRCLVTCTGSGLTDSTSELEIVVNPNPLPVITVTPGPQVAFCNGGNPVTLVASGAATYSWTPATGLSASSGDSVQASPTNSTNYTITGVDAFGCSAITNVTVQVANAPNFTLIANRTLVCSGDTTMLRAQGQGGPGGGNQYVWGPGGQTGNMVIVTVTAPTTYTVVGTNQAGCTRADSVFVDIQPGANAGFSYTMNNLTVSFTDTTTGALSWLWLFGDGNASFSQSPNYTYSAPGTYNVSLVVSNGVCGSDTVTQTITVSVTGLEENAAAMQMQLAPNPAHESVALSFFSSSPAAELLLLNAMGQEVVRRNITPSAANFFREMIETKHLEPGVYVVMLRTSNGSAAIRLVKE